MKKTWYLIAILSLGSVNQSHCIDSSFAYFLVWSGTASIEMLSRASKDLRHAIYGNNAISDSAEKNLRDIIENLKMEQPTDIKESRSLWPMMAGNAYSNYETLFLSTDVVHKLENNESLNDPTKRDLIGALLMINSHFDNKILAAFIATPIIIWTTAHCINAFIEKNKWDKNSLLSKLAHATAQQKIFFSTFLIALFTCYQRYAISSQVHVLMR